jgi:hypothetical protein
MANNFTSSPVKGKMLGAMFVGVIFAAVVGAVYWQKYGGSANPATPPKNEEVVCVQMIQLARNPQTGEERIFSTPCEVPAGWEKINEVSESAMWQAYSSEEFGFEIKLPDMWNGYKVAKQQLGSAFGSPTILKFTVKTAAPMQIMIYPILNWNDLTQENKDKVVFITNNDEYVFTYTAPEDLSADFEVPKVIATFKFIE